MFMLIRESIMKKQFGFTLIELIVVIMIIGILAAIAVPLMRGKIDSSKWTEANAGAGMIRTAVKTYFFDSEVAITGNLGDAAVQQALQIQSSDLTGAYFVPSDYEIDSVNADGVATVTVTGSQDNAPSGSKTLTADGVWQ